ncbi:MAG: GapR family DNA-binding domain-containing protein, partial [Pseudomonadota bacterium]
MADGTQSFENSPSSTDVVAADKLRLLIERVERLEEDKKAV